MQLPLTFADKLEQASDPQVGLWVCSGSSVCAELIAGAQPNWVLVDGEHSPIGLETIVGLLHTIAAYDATPVVRVPVLDTALIKQYLDLGAQNIMVPMVHTPQMAADAVAAMHYPPKGVRGVGSALARSSRWNRVPNYLGTASDTVSLTVQIESAQAVANAAAIAGTDGVDALFIGPADLAADMGLIGQQDHPKVIQAVKDTIAAAKAQGKKVGVNAFAPAQQAEYLAAGVDFIAVGADVQLLAKASGTLVKDTADIIAAHKG
ncbi:HpcH/HpaI aldolase family protein [Corynebacterium aquilae]|uniref:Alpha-dehydro-beta-deoxy-D-glucarate aldolase n=1 Tax=Corynebacterium aquilae DSM 44791 TaxID=1431546 RepID=A0A1L7CDK0_9CORY|nr:aldolase/citrate lyase family protein [Corynebacterium aquilae]APT83921.1 alpha-dehydro-beta-deoxy-D-glucarate aldolase [Corynebacterium aquilae DSM 44791]